MSDVGILDTCKLEQAVEAGMIDPGAVRVIGERPEKAQGGGRTSTPLYPDLMFAASPSPDPDVVKVVTVALLSLPADALGCDWLSNTRMQDIEPLLRDFKVGPYEFLATRRFPLRLSATAIRSWYLHSCSRFSSHTIGASTAFFKNESLRLRPRNAREATRPKPCARVAKSSLWSNALA